MADYNVSFGTQNFSSINTSSSEASNLTAQEFGKQIGKAFELAVGDPQVLGLLMLFFEGYVLYRYDVGLDGATALIVPSLFIFGKYGFLPMAQGTMYGTLLAVGGLFTAGLLRYWR